MDQPEVRPFASTQTTRWANGNGETRELRAWPDVNAHQWRLSIATISSDQPFSHFAEVDRALMVLSPAGVSLRIEDETAVLKQYDAVSFAGEKWVVPVGVVAPSMDLNFFAPRTKHMLSLKTLAIRRATTIQATAVVALEGALRFRDAGLSFGDCVFNAESGEPGPFEILGEGLVAIAVIS